MKKIILPFVCVAGMAFPAFADLASARASGQVCEGSDGYIVATSAQANSLASEINAKRRAEYQKISSQNGQTAAVVGQLAAKQIVSQPGVRSCP